MAALVGVMMMVAITTYEWASFKVINKMPKHDIFVGILVALITIVLHNLALAVLIGVVISALVFAWESARRIRARKYIDEDGVKHYEIFGPLFFGSTTAFLEKFDVQDDPSAIVIDFKENDSVVIMTVKQAVTINNTFQSNQNTVLNQWTHLVLSFDTDSLKLYINGQFSTSIAWGGTYHAGLQKLLIGSNFKSNFGSFSAKSKA